MTLLDLVARWRQDAELLDRRGAPDQAAAARAFAKELEEWITAWELEQLSVTDAAAESGYDASTLRRLFPGCKAIARRDLPRKPTRREGPDLVDRVLQDAS